MIPVVFSTDHNYVMPTGITICSLLLNRRNNSYHIYVLISSDVTEEDKFKLESQVYELDKNSKISFLEMGSLFQSGYEIREISTACYYRLMIPWLIPHEDKIIYCDVDVIFQTDLTDIYGIDLKDSYVAGGLPNTKDGWKQFDKYFKKIGLDYKKYINSGILVINSKLQRENNLREEYSKLAEQRFLYQDQDIINIVCKDKISYFNKRFNLFPSHYATESDLCDNVIIHYAGDKPWKSFTYAWAEWWKVYEKSIFFDGKFYHDVAHNILNPKEQVKLIIKKGKAKLQQIYAKHKFV